MGKVTFDGKAHATRVEMRRLPHQAQALRNEKKQRQDDHGRDERRQVLRSCHDGKKTFGVKARPIARNAIRQAAQAPSPTRRHRRREGIPGEYVDDAVITTKVKAAVLEERRQVGRNQR